MGSVGKKSLSIQHRSRWDIMASILRAGTAGRSKTHIMHKCNLSYRQLQAYLDLLRDRGLLKVWLHQEKGNPGKILVTTDKGRVFLKAYGNLRATIERDNSKSYVKVRT